MQQARVLEGAEEFRLGEGRVGVLLIHGFTSTPQVVRPLGAYLAARGLTAVGPRLPGHGTTWRDLNLCNERDWTEAAQAAFDELAATTEEVFVAGFSFGAALGAHLVAHNQERVAGLVMIASFLATRDPRRFLSPVMRRIVESLPGVGNDTADADAEREIVYDRLPTSAAHCMLRFTKTARLALSSITRPVLIVHGRNDHTAPPFNARLAYDSIASEDKELVWLERSYHVLTMDYDREELFERTYRFIKERSRAL